MSEEEYYALAKQKSTSAASTELKNGESSIKKLSEDSLADDDYVNRLLQAVLLKNPQLSITSPAVLSKAQTRYAFDGILLMMREDGEVVLQGEIANLSKKMFLHNVRDAVTRVLKKQELPASEDEKNNGNAALLYTSGL